ncbi:DUF4062 domain-containing protein [Sphingomonas sp. A2-49]|uniref:DUF4062 domain-containing protein n=1 Tax=Sphingomonas sp. A2-49 TaxID=1391375 RepID=UPI0021D25F5D|nr:DUF4062 domain-containing protein [Sphingomonas sp. A2-49]MCU6456140.1 DUF4062 domain-containing protein [Sphingomonas sp. A2-49]
MSYSVRHQVFVSSTFTDLIEERTEVIQALWELDCIPTGMEAFVASNDSQWEVIRKVIDECDYYVLIIGGRYGSVTDDGVSYTEKEYRYAKKIGLPVLAFVHGNPEAIAVGKTEKVEANRLKLEAFRSEVMADYPVRSWSSASELGGLVSRSVVREIKVNPRPGWIRNDGSSPIALLERINTLTEENRTLRDEVSAQSGFEIDEALESGSDEIEVHGSRMVYSKERGGSYTEGWSALVTWDDMFRDIGPALINETTEPELQRILARFHSYDELEAGVSHRGFEKLAPESWNEVLVQFRALGLLDQGVKKRGVNDKASYWRITPKGDRHLVNLLARRKTVPAA